MPTVTVLIPCGKDGLKLRSVQEQALHHSKEKTETDKKSQQTDIKTDTADTEQSRDLEKEAKSIRFPLPISTQM